MTIWLVAACVLLAGGILPAGIIAGRGSAPRRLVGLELASTTATLLMLALCQALHQPGYLIVPLVLALLSFAGTLVFTRLLDMPDD